jgi:mRNA interferase MazF
LIHRGDAVALRPPRGAVGREQRGRRYAVVIQAEEVAWLTTVVVVPTSSSAQPAIFRPEVTVRGQRTRLLTDQVSTVDRSRIGRSVGRISPAELQELDESLKRILGLF